MAWSATCSRSFPNLPRRCRERYHAPLADMTFVMNELAGLSQVSHVSGFEDATPDTVAAILEEASKFATDVLDPLNQSGDREGAQAFRMALSRPRQDSRMRTSVHGQRLEWTHQESSIWRPGLAAARVYAGRGDVARRQHGFRLCPLLTQGAIEAIELAAATC